MTFLIVLGLVIVVAVAVLMLQSTDASVAQVNGRATLLATGLEARGLILEASSTSTRRVIDGQRFDVRSVVLDVEIAGRPPYEFSVDAAFPRLCEALPGAALDLRVDPADPENIAVVGPAGSSAWMAAAPWLNPPATPSVAAASQSGCARPLVIALIGVWLVAAVIVGAVNLGKQASKRDTRRPEIADVPPPVAAPTHASCAAATRCCKTLDLENCGAFESMTDAACKRVLTEQKKTAAKLHTRCQ